MNNKKPKDSPCISVCSIDDDIGFCRGCLRSLDEISRWKVLKETEKKSILRELDQRRELYKDALQSPYANQELP